MNIAVIPARGGSKRINRKNIKIFCGKPIIYWPIKKALESNIFEKIVISTDDLEIADISKSLGAEVLFERPKSLSDDYTGISEVLAHAVSWMAQNNINPKAVCCIYPTSVFFSIQDLRNGYKAINSGDWEFSFSVTNFEYPIFRSFENHPQKGIKMFFPKT